MTSADGDAESIIGTASASAILSDFIMIVIVETIIRSSPAGSGFTSSF